MTRIVKFALIVTTGLFLALSVLGVTRVPEEPQVVYVTLKDFSIQASQFVVTSERPVRFVVSNQGALPHQFIVRPLAQAKMTNVDDEPMIAPSTRRTFDTTLKPGIYSIECDSKDHLERGMVTAIASEVRWRGGFNPPAGSILPVLLLVIGAIYIIGDSMGFRLIQNP